MKHKLIKSLKGKKFAFFAEWINGHADFYKHEDSLDFKYTIKVGKEVKPNHITEFGRGYHQAVSDIFGFLYSNKKYEELKKEVSKS